MIRNGKYGRIGRMRSRSQGEDGPGSEAIGTDELPETWQEWHLNTAKMLIHADKAWIRTETCESMRILQKNGWQERAEDRNYSQNVSLANSCYTIYSRGQSRVYHGFDFA